MTFATIAVPPCPPGEYARLMAKGQTLWDHCVAEVSSVCVIGFVEHELAKGPEARRVVLDLVAWMLGQIPSLPDAERLAVAEEMVAESLALLFHLETP